MTATYRARLIYGLLTPWFIVIAQSVLADGMVVPQVFYPKVEIPNQQALIHFANGVERLVIETSFLGEGTNFAWVVPLPSAPEVKPVSEDFFSGLQQAFQPRLVHQVYSYYAGVLFFCGLVFLGWRSLRDEASWVADLPLCLVLGAGMGLMERNMVAGLVAAGLALATRISSRTPASLALLLLIGTAFDAGLMFIPSPVQLGLIQTLGGSNSATETDGIPGVSVLSVQRAGAGASWQRLPESGSPSSCCCRKSKWLPIQPARARKAGLADPTSQLRPSQRSRHAKVGSALIRWKPLYLRGTALRLETRFPSHNQPLAPLLGIIGLRMRSHPTDPPSVPELMRINLFRLRRRPSAEVGA